MAEFYVDTQRGNDASSGDKDHPLCTVACAIARAREGDLIRWVTDLLIVPKFGG